MAKTSSWIPHVEAFVDSSRSSNEQKAGLEAITSLVKNGMLTLEALVKGLELYLTTTDHVLRARGILFLAELIACLASKPLDSTTIHSLARFFTEKLADWQALHGALVGCLALLRRKSNVGTVTDIDARSLTQSYLQNIQVQSLGKHDRKLCFEILECLLGCYSGAVATLGDNLIYGMCEAIDGEMDPECLMLTFHLVSVLGQVFPDPFGPLAGFAEDLFDVLGRYFPIHFTHQHDDFDVKRDDLSKALMLAFASTPLFEPFAIPLLLEKLSSSLTLAKVDSLKYLSNLSIKYGADRMAKHAKVIWSSLKGAIFTAYKEPIISRVLDVANFKGFQDNEIAKEAVVCLQKFMLQDDGLFLSMILEDEDIEPTLRSIASFKSYNDITMESKQKLHALGCILAASVSFSGACSNRVFRSFFPCLMDASGYSETNLPWDCISDVSCAHSDELNFGALYLCVEVIVAFRDLVLGFEGESQEEVSAVEETCLLLQRFSGQLTKAFCSILITAKKQEICNAHVYCGVKGLQILATFPRRFLLLSKSLFEMILTVFMSVIIAGCEMTLLWKHTLSALMQIGMFIEKSSDSEAEASYMVIVVEKISSLICLDDSATPLPLLLEAFSDIGTTCLKFMLRVNQGLEEAVFANLLDASGKDNSKLVNILISLLECYSSKVLSWFIKTRDFDNIALHFAITMWNHIETSSLFNIGVQGKELLNKMMMTMRLAVAGCSEDNQGLIVQKAFAALSSITFLPLKDLERLFVPLKLEGLLTQEFHSFSCRDEWIISLFASVIVALRPQTPLQNVTAILRFFATSLLKGNVPSAQALGSLVNKLPSSSMAKLNLYTVEEAFDIIFKMGLFDHIPSSKFHSAESSSGGHTNLCHYDDRGNFVQSNAIIGLAWIGKGLIMRGHVKLNIVITMLLRCLLSSDEIQKPESQNKLLVECNGRDTDQLIARTAADAFHVLLHDSDVCLSKRFHATIRPLYKQHFFSNMMPILLSSIKDSKSSATRYMLSRAFGHVISEAPLSAVVTEAKQLIFVLLDGMSMLSADAQDKDLTYSLLLVLSGILVDENGREAVLENAHIIIKLLVGLVSYPYMMLVRETAIQCLVAMAGLPYTRIYPMRSQVLGALIKALDDPKRNVRQEAVRCRHAWFLGTNLHAVLSTRLAGSNNSRKFGDSSSGGTSLTRRWEIFERLRELLEVMRECHTA